MIPDRLYSITVDGENPGGLVRGRDVGTAMETLLTERRPDWDGDDRSRVLSAMDTLLYRWPWEPSEAEVAGVRVSIVPSGMVA